MNDIARKMIKENEGLRLQVYRCTADKQTIGYGRNLEDKGINKIEAEFMLRNDIDEIDMQLSQNGLLGLLDPAREAVLYDMAYQMGITGLLKFKNMLSALKSGDYITAAHELLDSKYAKQTPSRAERNADIIRGEKL